MLKKILPLVILLSVLSSAAYAVPVVSKLSFAVVANKTWVGEKFNHTFVSGTALGARVTLPLSTFVPVRYANGVNIQYEGSKDIYNSNWQHRASLVWHIFP